MAVPAPSVGGRCGRAKRGWFRSPVAHGSVNFLLPQHFLQLLELLSFLPFFPERIFFILYHSRADATITELFFRNIALMLTTKTYAMLKRCYRVIQCQAFFLWVSRKDDGMNLPSFSFVFSGRPVKFCFHTTLLAEVATPLHRLIAETMDDSERNLKKIGNSCKLLPEGQKKPASGAGKLNTISSIGQ